MKSTFWGIVISVVSVLVSACSMTGSQYRAEGKSVSVDKIITASGSGRSNLDNSDRPRLHRFSAEQSAKMSAYRKMAAILYQEHLPGGLTVAGQVLKNEVYRLYFDLYLRKAKVLSQQPLGNTLNVTLALVVDDRFYRCMAADQAFIRQCLQQDNKIPFTRLGYKTATQKTVNLSCSTADCGGNFDIGGFTQGKNIVDKGLLSAGLYDSEWILNTSSRIFIEYLLLNGIPK